MLGDMRAILSLGLMLGVLACSSTDPSAFVGVYKTTSHTAIDQLGVPCTNPGTPVPNGDPYFKLAVSTFFNDPNELAVSGCSDAAGTTCVETQTDMGPGGPGLQMISSNIQTGGGSSCQLYWTRAQATLTGTAIHIELLDKYDDPAIPSSECTLDKAEALRDSPTCRSVELWDGTRQ